MATQPPTTTPPPPTTPFPFPQYYNFPPLFTLQPSLQTRHAQLTKWSNLILSYCRHHRIFKLSLIDALETELFHNKVLGRRLEMKDAREVLEGMRREGRVEWISSNTGRGGEGKGGEGEGGLVCWVWWRNVEEWAGVVYDWVDETAQKNTVLTLYELTESEATISQEFHHMDPDLLQKALNHLVKRGKAQVFGQEDQQGVKFF